jgi:hypothetical protein
VRASDILHNHTGEDHHNIARVSFELQAKHLVAQGGKVGETKKLDLLGQSVDAHRLADTRQQQEREN